MIEGNSNNLFIGAYDQNTHFFDPHQLSNAPVSPFTLVGNKPLKTQKGCLANTAAAVISQISGEDNNILLLPEHFVIRLVMLNQTSIYLTKLISCE